MSKLLPAATLLILLTAPSDAAEGIITAVNWPNIDAYCTFQRAEATFDYNDPGSWNFVYFTQHAIDGGEVGYVSINHRLRELELVETVQGKDGEMRHYRTYGADPYEVTLTMSIAQVGYENTDYKGYLTAKGARGEETIAVKGGCGV